jgi:hypothetical protein
MLITKNSFGFIILIVAVFIINSDLIVGQRIVDTNKGNHNYTKKGYLDGNLAATVYYNFGEIADWLNEPSRSGVWPKGTNHTYVDGVAIIVQSEATDPAGKLIHPLETNYYEYTRYNSATGVTYGWWPLPGYNSPYSTIPARSDVPESWPERWPDRTSDWNGSWNGFFGKGVQNADVETYFVFDDNEDREYLLNNNFTPDTDDPTRGGLGMQVRARGFQWSQVLAEDVIFWYYEITNMGTYDYQKTLFAQYVDWGIGGSGNDNSGDYNELLDMSYAWSFEAVGQPGNWSPVGLAGYAFLESPAAADDSKDNDSDGLTDEKRNNNASIFITDPNQDPYLRNPFQDTTKFKQFYGYSWRPHWDADENANWRSYTDLNDNGEWDKGEPLNNDVGTDGIGPFDTGYTGPDVDGTEANGRPDEGEPNFGILDKDESDQLGLTGFLIFPTHTPYDLNNDELNWTGLSGLPAPHGQLLIGVNLANYFSSYLFSMNGRNTYSAVTGENQEEGETERFSMSMIFGINKDDLFRRKKTVQQIYNANYRFAKPPEKPIVTAIPGDHKVILYWDDRAEKTFDEFYQRVNFEGYRVYRSTEPNFLEDKIITDAYGKPIFRSPIAQFDLIDGVTGLHPINVNGAMFYLGNDSGLKHSFIDTTVQNGQTYYYAVAAYDRGFETTTIEGNFEGIPPSETTTILKKDINGNITTDINTAVITPRAPAAGYLAPEIASFEGSGPGTGNISISILNPDLLKDISTYRLEFDENTPYHNSAHPYYSLINVVEGDTLVNIQRVNGVEEQTPVLDGFTVNIKSDTAVTIDFDKTVWEKGNSNFRVPVGYDSRFQLGNQVYYPADFEIILTEPDQGDLSFPATRFSQPIQSNIIVNNLTEGTEHFQFIFEDMNTDKIFNAGDAIFFVFGDSLGKRATGFSSAHIGWSVTLTKDTTIAEDQQREPQYGDVFKVVTTKPFRKGEFYEFTIKGQRYDRTKAESDMNKVLVVPNPYVGAASWEPSTTEVGRGERRIYFMHLPSECRIRIYTISGKFVDEIQHSSSISDGQESWDLVSKDGMDIAFGVYVYQVDAPDVGQKIGKFAVIK